MQLLNIQDIANQLCCGLSRGGTKPILLLLLRTQALPAFHRCPPSSVQTPLSQISCAGLDCMGEAYLVTCDSPRLPTGQGRLCPLVEWKSEHQHMPPKGMSMRLGPR